MNRPIVSVIIPVYNVAPYLRECLDSVRRLSLQDMEIICIDDASADESYQILMEYAAKDERFVLLKNAENRGLSCTRNAGLQEAGGKYILFLDSDDCVSPALFDKLLNKAEGNDMVSFDYLKLSGGKEEITHNYQIPDGLYTGHEFLTELVERRSVFYSACSRLYRRNFLERNHIRFYEGILYEDRLFFFQCLVMAERIYSIRDKLYFYRKRKQSIMNSEVTLQNMESYFIVICELLKCYHSHEFDERANRAAQQYIKDVCLMFKKASRRCEKGPQKEAIRLKDPKMKGLFEICVETFHNEGFFCLEQRQKIGQWLEQGKKILIYGAGDIAWEAIEALDGMDIPICGVAVSSVKGNRRSILGNPVRQIEEYADDKGAGAVIVATGLQFHEDIHALLKKYGFEEYLDVR